MVGKKSVGRQASIKDVARRAGVNVATVSRAVNDDETARKVNAAIGRSRLAHAREAKPDTVRMPRVLADHGLVDGSVLIGRHSENLLQPLDEASLPWVLLGDNFDGDVRRLRHNVLSYDHEAGASEAASWDMSGEYGRLAAAEFLRRPHPETDTRYSGPGTDGRCL